jgi:hypothetical protein
MVWAKTPAAAASVLCAACLAMTAAMPAVETAAERAARTVSTAVQPVVNFEALDLLDAVPGYEDILNGQVLEGLSQLDSTNAVASLLALLLGGNTAALENLASTDGIQPWAEFLATGDLTVFARDENLEGGVDLVSALPEYQAIINGTQEEQLEALGRLDSTSAIPAYVALAGGNLGALGALDSTSAIPSYLALATGDASALGNLASTDAVPAYSTLASHSATLAEKADALRSLDAFSAIPEYLNLPSVPPPPSPTASPAPSPTASPSQSPSALAKAELPELQGMLAPEGKTGETAPVTPSDGSGTVSTAVTVDPATSGGTPSASEKEGKSGNGSYSGAFKPNLKLPILFGSGSGSGADNGIRGWSDGLNKIKKALSGGGSKGGEKSPGGSDSGDGTGGGGDAK